MAMRQGDESTRLPRRRLRAGCIGVLAGVALTVVAAALFTAREVAIRIRPETVRALCQQQAVEEDVREVRWSPDGQRVAWVRWEAPVEIRDAGTHRLLGHIGENKKIIHFAFSPDPDVVAFCENTMDVEIHDSTGASIRLETSNHQPRMTFSPDGDLIATGGYGRYAGLWEVRTGRLRASPDMGSIEGGLTPLFSPDGEILAVGNRNSDTRLFDVRTGQLVRALPRRSTQGLAFSPDGSRLAVSYVDGHVGLWSVPTGKMLHLQKAGEEIYRVVWSPDGSLLVSAGRGANLCFWDPESLKVLRSVSAPDWIISVSFRPDGRRLLVAGGSRRPKGARSLRVLEVRALDWLMARLGIGRGRADATLP